MDRWRYWWKSREWRRKRLNRERPSANSSWWTSILVRSLSPGRSMASWRGGRRRAGGRSAAVDRGKPGGGLRVAGELSGAGAVREERTYPEELPAGAGGGGRRSG